MEALRAAIANGCDAVYLGMQKFGARAYSDNFDEEGLAEAVSYAHLRDVKVYVTMNTIVFEDELGDMRRQLQYLNEIRVDGVIVQDLAVFEYIVEHFPDMEAHCSTQMGIDDLDGTLMCKELGAKRVVLARETAIDKAVRIKKQADVPIEIFVHGALCVSYSGNCLMSGLIGYRSGNRGRCVGSCRKLYELVKFGGIGSAGGWANSGNEQSLGTAYFLSTKDLNTIEYIDKLRALDSLKIEGRMKEPAYVANVTAKYRAALDRTLTADGADELKKTFNRTFTKGYIFGEDPRDITNISKPNNFGYEIGEIGGSYKGMYEIRLTDELRQNDIIRIDHTGEDVNLSVVKLYDRDGNLINHADSVCYIKIKERLAKGDKVYKTKDYEFYKELEKHMDGEFRRFPLDLQVYAYPGAVLTINAEGLGASYYYEGTELLEPAKNQPTSYEQVRKQLAKLGDTVLELRTLDFEESGAFIPVKLLNEARREIVEQLYAAKLASKPNRVLDGEQTTRAQAAAQAEEALASSNCDASASVAEQGGLPQAQLGGLGAAPAGCGSHGALAEPQPPLAPEQLSGERQAGRPMLTASVVTQQQYEACKAAGISTVYYDNIIRRNQIEYTDREGELLIGGYGGLHHYRASNPFVTDYSFNVVNSVSCHRLMELGAERVTLSYEINKKQIADLLAAYRRDYGQSPSLEMIVYGRAPLIFTKYCPLKKMNQCGQCKQNHYELRDEYGMFPILSHADCTTTILNGKILNLLDEMPSIEGIAAFRLNFTTETPAEVTRIATAAQQKLAGSTTPLFNRETDTRGHYNREII